MRVLFDDTVNDAISGAVKDGDQVIVDGQLRVTPGAKVTIARARESGKHRDSEAGTGSGGL